MAILNKTIIGIESSCDDTAVAIYHSERGVLSHVMNSQIDLHQPYGGVVPELASRDHVRYLAPLVNQALADAGLTAADLDAVAYTAGPGLVGALLVGAGYANALAASLDIPTVPVHHMEAHSLVALIDLDEPIVPYVMLLVSGGHSELVLVEKPGQYRLVGHTVDDAAGEAFDKAAKCMGLGYPGGPLIAALAKTGDASRFSLPIPMAHSGNCMMSFSGLKTALWQTWNRCDQTDQDRADLAASFQKTVVDTLLLKTKRAVEESGVEHLVMAGGVAANDYLRKQLHAWADTTGVTCHFPRPEWCTDNGVMVAYAGYQRYRAGFTQSAGAIAAQARWSLEDLQPMS